MARWTVWADVEVDDDEATDCCEAAKVAYQWVCNEYEMILHVFDHARNTHRRVLKHGDEWRELD